MKALGSVAVEHAAVILHHKDQMNAHLENTVPSVLNIVVGALAEPFLSVTISQDGILLLPV